VPNPANGERSSGTANKEHVRAAADPLERAEAGAKGAAAAGARKRSTAALTLTLRKQSAGASVGLTLRSDDEQALAVVEIIVPGGIAAAAGFHVGDRLQTVAGAEVRNNVGAAQAIARADGDVLVTIDRRLRKRSHRLAALEAGDQTKRHQTYRRRRARKRSAEGGSGGGGGGGGGGGARTADELRDEWRRQVDDAKRALDLSLAARPPANQMAQPGMMVSDATARACSSTEPVLPLQPSPPSSPPPSPPGPSGASPAERLLSSLRYWHTAVSLVWPLPRRRSVRLRAAQAVMLAFNVCTFDLMWMMRFADAPQSHVLVAFVASAACLGVNIVGRALFASSNVCGAMDGRCPSGFGPSVVLAWTAQLLAFAAMLWATLAHGYCKELSDVRRVLAFWGTALAFTMLAVEPLLALCAAGCVSGTSLNEPSARPRQSSSGGGRQIVNNGTPVVVVTPSGVAESSRTTSKPTRVQTTIELIKRDSSARLGVSVHEMMDSVRGRVVVVSALQPGCVAERSGLKVGDIVLRVDGHTPRAPAHCTDLVKSAQLSAVLVVERSSGETQYERV
jgi:membrane-associated protease RseP (regulator of RpoE activity)